MINRNNSIWHRGSVRKTKASSLGVMATTLFLFLIPPVQAEVSSGCGETSQSGNETHPGLRTFVDQGIRFSNRVQVPPQPNSSIIEIQERDLTFPDVCLCAKTPSDPRSVQATAILRSLHTRGVRVTIPKDCHRRMGTPSAPSSVVQPFSDENPSS